MKLKMHALAAFVTMGLCSQVNAAYITIDDSNANTITITAGDFEYGFSVNGVALNSGLSVSDSVTLADGAVFSFFGNWIDLGGAQGSQSAWFSEISFFLQSGVELNAYSEGGLGYISGIFTGYDPTKSYGLATFSPQDGSTASGGFAYLSWSFESETASVPDAGATIALLGGALLGLTTLRRRLVK